MMHKIRPHEAVRSARLFVTKERERLVKAKQLTKEQAAEREKASDEAEELVRNSKVGVIATADEVSNDEPVSNPVTNPRATESSSRPQTTFPNFPEERNGGSKTVPTASPAENLTESVVIVDA